MIFLWDIYFLYYTITWERNDKSWKYAQNLSWKIKISIQYSQVDTYKCYSF